MKTKNRFDEFGLLKAISIMGLPFVHLMSEVLNQEIGEIAVNDLLPLMTALCLFGPTVFMLCMGFGLAGGKTSARQLRREGVQFLLIGLLLNILRALIPYTLMSVVLHKPYPEAYEQFVISDIYYFVGLYFLFLSVMRQLNISLPGITLISLLMLTVNMALSPWMAAWFSGSPKFVREFLGNFVYVDEYSSFPVLGWTVYPTLGLCLGTALRKTDVDTKKGFMLRMLLSSLTVLAAVLVFRWTQSLSLEAILNPFSGTSDLSIVVALVCVTLIVVYLGYLLCCKVSGTKFLDFMLRISSNIIIFYLSQWILVRWIVCILCLCGCPQGAFTMAWYLVTSVAIIALSAFIALKFGMKIMIFLLKVTSPWNYGRSRKKKRSAA